MKESKEKRDAGEFVPVRLSHLLRHCSVGAIVRGPKGLMTVKDIRFWTDRRGNPAGRLLSYVDGVRSALGIDAVLREPPVAGEIEPGLVDGVCIPALRFPSWMRCPNPGCGSLHFRPWLDKRRGEPRCRHCDRRPLLEQTPWILVHPDGHMNDVPWHYLAHREAKTGGQRHCKADGKEAYLRLTETETGQRRLHCDRCRATIDFSPGIRIPFGNAHRQPWLRDPPDAPGALSATALAGVPKAKPLKNTGFCSSGRDMESGNFSVMPDSRFRGNDCMKAGVEFFKGLGTTTGAASMPVPATAPADRDELAHILGINDVRVHSAVTHGALVIPPESRIRKGAIVDRLYRSSRKRQRLEEARTPLAWRGTVKRLAAEFRCTGAELEAAWKEILRGYPLYGQNLTHGLLLEREYAALLEEIPDMGEDEDFVTRNLTAAWQTELRASSGDPRLGGIIHVVDQLVSVERLKEVQALKGFRRLGGALTPPDIVGRSDWLPAVELYGEGVFFTLKEEALVGWEHIPALAARAEEFRRRAAGADIRFEPPPRVSPRFLLLHTLAHLLIRQLEMEAGYSAASLKERIYCLPSRRATSTRTREEPWNETAAAPAETPMAGILVYVAAPDVAGSLGGLAELAAPRRFLSLLGRVFAQARWCSFDPVCGEHDGQGPGLLNRAACHACALIPDPACIYGNVLLDRTFIRGGRDGEIPAFLDHARQCMGTQPGAAGLNGRR